MKEYLLGTAIKIIALLNVATPTTATITIEDQGSIEKISDVAMTKDADAVYSYIWQSASTDNSGTYVARLTIVSGGYTAVKEYKMELILQSDL